jgi:hypothetical protein
MLLLLLAACSDYKLQDEKTDPVFEDDDTAVDTDVDTDTAPIDTADTGEGGECADRSYPGGALTQDPDCYGDPTTGTFTPEVEWEWSTFTVDPSSENVMATPIVVSLTDDNGDGAIDDRDTPDIVFVTYTGTDWSDEGVIRAVSGDGTVSLFDIDGEQIDGCSGLAAADLDGDGRVEIVAMTWNKRAKAFDVDGNLLWTSPSLASYANIYAPTPAISDMDGDGSPEIIIGSAILNADGTLRGGGAYGIGTAGMYGTTSFAVDVDGDGQEEVVVGNALYDIDGNAIWHNGQSDGYVAVGDFDADGEGEIVVVAGGQVRLQDGDGSVLWTAAIAGAGAGFGGPPTIADFDGDGAPEVGVAANSTYTVFDTDGTQLWQQTTQDGSSGVTGSSVFDFEGDGIAEVIYADELTIWGFDGPDGAVKLSSTEHSNWTVIEYPVIADVDGDDEAEIVVPNGLHPSYGGAHHGIVVLGDADHSWRSGRRIWNEHAYHITNIDDDGSVPATADLNWLTYNNFRSGDVSAAVGSTAPDLVVDIVDVCADYCDSGRLSAWIRVGNRGYKDVTGPLDLVLEAEMSTGLVEIGRMTLTDTFTAGTTRDAYQLDATGIPVGPITALYATIDAGDVSRECDEGNNVGDWTDYLCY